MRCYIVGGAVRDMIMGINPRDRDWVIVGASVEDVLSMGFIPVGKDFPVFLHPETKEEYALARTERKWGKGYKGFTFYASPDVSLEQDLLRRDLTINAIAMDEEGNMLDPFGGISDINEKVLRHVSPAFSEDPLRVLRLARFSARYPDFSICSETLKLSRQLVASGELQDLVTERVWQEIAKGLSERQPQKMFSLLFLCDAFFEIFQEFCLCKENKSDVESFFCYCGVKDYFTVLENFAYYFAEFLNNYYLTLMARRMKIPGKFLQISLLWRKCVTGFSGIPKDSLGLVEWFDMISIWRCPDMFGSVNKLLARRFGLPSEVLTELGNAFEKAAAVRLLDSEIEGLSSNEIKDILKIKRIKAISA